MGRGFSGNQAELELDSFDNREVNSIESLYANFASDEVNVRETGDNFNQFYNRIRSGEFRRDFLDAYNEDSKVMLDENVLHNIALN